MGFRADRIGRGEWLLVACSCALLGDLFGVGWFRDRTGWQALHVLGSLTVVVCVLAIVLWWLQATRRSPALPTILITMLLPVSLVVFLLLAFRALIDTPGTGGARAGAYIGLALSFGLVAGAYSSLRREGVARADSAPVVETISVRAARPRADT